MYISERPGWPATLSGDSHVPPLKVSQILETFVHCERTVILPGKVFSD